MNSNKIANHLNEISLRQAALVAGFGLLIMVITGLCAQMFAYESLIVWGEPTETAKNIMNNKMLFTTAILGFLIVFIFDLPVAWALYIFLKPVNKSVSLLTAWFRLVYAGIAIMALPNLAMALRYTKSYDYLTVFEPDELYVKLYLTIVAFEKTLGIGLIVFGIHLVLVGYLVLRSGYVPRIVSILLIISGLGWLIDSLRPFLFPTMFSDIWIITVWGEVVFMLWLLIKGWKIQEVS